MLRILSRKCLELVRVGEIGEALLMPSLCNRYVHCGDGKKVIGLSDTSFEYVLVFARFHWSFCTLSTTLQALVFFESRLLHDDMLIVWIRMLSGIFSHSGLLKLLTAGY